MIYSFFLPSMKTISDKMKIEHYISDLVFLKNLRFHRDKMSYKAFRTYFNNGVS